MSNLSKAKPICRAFQISISLPINFFIFNKIVFSLEEKSFCKIDAFSVSTRIPFILILISIGNSLLSKSQIVSKL